MVRWYALMECLVKKWGGWVNLNWGMLAARYGMG